MTELRRNLSPTCFFCAWLKIKLFLIGELLRRHFYFGGIKIIWHVVISRGLTSEAICDFVLHIMQSWSLVEWIWLRVWLGGVVCFNISFRCSPANAIDTVFMTSDKRIPVIKSRYLRIFSDLTSIPVDRNQLHFRALDCTFHIFFTGTEQRNSCCEKMWIINAMGSRPWPRAGPWPEVCQWLSLYLRVCVRERAWIH